MAFGDCYYAIDDCYHIVSGNTNPWITPKPKPRPTPKLGPGLPRYRRLVREMLKQQQGRCFYCNCDISRPSTSNHATIDHVVPKSKGGISHPSNYVIACVSCNSRKGDMSQIEFLETMASIGV